jgi:hypothetical protein
LCVYPSVHPPGNYFFKKIIVWGMDGWMDIQYQDVSTYLHDWYKQRI